MSPGVASMLKRAAGVRPSALTMTPVSSSWSATSTADSSTPPGLLRRSSDHAARLRADVAAQARDAGGEILGRGVAETVVMRAYTIAAVERDHRDAVHVDLRALDGEFERQRVARAHDGELHLRAARAAHARHRGVEIGATGAPSIAAIMSPLRMPAAAAGESRNGRTTRSARSAVDTSMPMPA